MLSALTEEKIGEVSMMIDAHELMEQDKDVYNIIQKELLRQKEEANMIPSEMGK